MSVSQPWLISGSDVMKHYKVKSQEQGLTQAQVDSHRVEFGHNEIPQAQSTSIWVLILNQFQDLMVLILLGAAVVSFILALIENSEDRLTAFVEPAVILIILICNATVGVLQETKAASAIDKLKESEASDAIVVRNGQSYSIPARDLVPGDIIIVSEGEKIPADARILTIKTNIFLAEEPALTGESEPATKISETLQDASLSNGDKRNLLFSGSLCVKGRCTAVVTYTGTQTELGRIAKDLDDDDEESKTPLQAKLDEFGEQLSKVISVICILVWVININHFNDPIHGNSWVKGGIYYLNIAVALAVAAIPEGLPAVVTTCLAIGAQKMAAHGAIVRNLPSVETLGCTTVICSDKTGTLTTNMMSAQHIVTVSGGAKGKAAVHTYNVFGDSWSPYGQVVEGHDDDSEVLFPSVDVPTLKRVAQISSLCCESFLTVSKVIDEDTREEKVVFGKTGAATEAALLVLAEKLGTPEDDKHQVITQLNDDHDGDHDDRPSNLSYVDEIRASLPLDEQINYVRQFWEDRFTVEHVLEFQRNRKSMSVLVSENGKKGGNNKKGGQSILLCKGAAENVLDRCTRLEVDGNVVTLDSAMKTQLSQQLESMNSKGLRSLALAYHPDPPAVNDKIYKDDANHIDIESDLVLVAFVGVLDPPRQQVPDAIAKCREAGIRVVMITGDNKHTAEAISERINLITAEERAQYQKMKVQISYSGHEVEKMSPEELQQVVKTARIFSRVEHHHKLKIVEALKANGEIVAASGDGVNDATALKTADIGIAMGSGTSVAKEASKMVLLDDNFNTIVMSVEQGRTIYANTKQFIRYLISSNIGEVACIFGASALGLPEALLPVQLLWVNLVTDGLPATALGVNPPDKDVMTRKPRSSSEPIIDSWLFIRYLVIGIYVGMGTILGYIWWFLFSPRGPQITYWALTHFHQCASSAEPVFNTLVENAKAGLITGVTVAATDSREQICEAVFENSLPSTVSLSVLVTIEMFNAMNAVSENQSIFSVTPFSNIYVILAAILSFILHFVILYVPWFASVFHTFPLNFDEWYIVVIFSLPVFVIDEILKAISRYRLAKQQKLAAAEKYKID